LQWGVENDGKMRWRKEVMNHLNMFNSAPRGHVARFRWSRGAQGGAEREMQVDKAGTRGRK